MSEDSMKLYYVPISPFARKVILTASVLGIRDKLELISMDIFNAPENFRKINPLIKVPALETDSGEYLVNSPFICQYLSQTTPGCSFCPRRRRRGGNFPRPAHRR